MGNCGFFRSHDWKTVAIDTTNGWSRTDLTTKDVLYKADHIIKFLVCKNCGKRSIISDDAKADGRKFAMEGHSEIAIQRAIWEETGKITGYRNDSITWVDKSYAPLKGFEEIINSLKKDPEFKDMLQHQMIDDALGQLEVAVKLYVNNQPQKDTK